MQLCAFMLSSSSRSRPLSFQLESNRLFLLALRSIALLVMPHLMTSKLPSGTPESARSFIGLVKILEKQLTLEDVQQLAVLPKSMKEVTMIWQKLLSDNGNVLPPEWNADEDLRNVQHRCDDRLFSQVGRALATVLTELLQVIDLDIENLTDIVEHLNKMSSTKENSNNALAQEKTKLASCQSQDDIRRQSLEQLQVLRKKRQAVEEEEKQIQALIADIDKRQNSAMLSTTAASKPAEILPNRCIDSATRARIFMQEYEKKRKLTMPAQKSTETIKIGDQMWSPTQLFERCKILKDEKDRALSAKIEQEKKLIQETIKTNRAVALAKKKARILQVHLESTVAFFN